MAFFIRNGGNASKRAKQAAESQQEANRTRKKAQRRNKSQQNSEPEEKSIEQKAKEELIEDLKTAHSEAKRRKDWEAADTCRDQLEMLGFVVNSQGCAVHKDKFAKKQAKKQRQKERKKAEAAALKQAEAAEPEEDEPSEPESDESEEEDLPPARKIACGVMITDIKIGQGQFAALRRPVKLHYVGYLESGEEFERSRSDKPLKFRLGRGEVIKGWDLGVEGMRVGGKRRIVCPPGAAYGTQAVPGNPKKGTSAIPPNATLTFDVTLVEAKS